MPRTVRNLSEYSIYHIVIKGNNSQKIFFDDNDYLTFLNTLKQSCNNYHISIIAYCLMSNHIHLMLKADDNNIAPMFKAFGASFVYKYNRKYERTGSLFNGRYYSKAVNDEKYFLTVLKYIHYNPVRAGICGTLSEYQWSSYNAYVKLFDGFTLIKEPYVDCEYLQSVISKDEFEMLHIDNDEDLFNFFMVDYDTNKSNFSVLHSIKDELLANYSVDEVISKLLGLGVSRVQIGKMLGIDRRKLNNYK